MTQNVEQPKAGRQGAAAVCCSLQIIGYFRDLSRGRVILWCYLVWYAVMLAHYFDASPRLWLSSLGISLIIGFALVISTTSTSRGSVPLERWQTFRLFLMPFCVSSFAALIKGQGFVLIFSPKISENIAAIGICLFFCATVWVLKAGKQPGA